MALFALERRPEGTVSWPGVAVRHASAARIVGDSFTRMWFAPSAAEELAAFASELDPDTVVLDQPWMLPYLDAVRARGRRVVLNASNTEGKLRRDLAAVRPTERARRLGARLADQVAQLERAAVAAVDQTWATSAVDAEVLAADDASVVVVPNAVDVDAYRSEAVREEALMIYPAGFHYAPNVVAATRLVDAVLPRVRRSVPGARLLLAGRAAPAELARTDAVEIAADVEDMRPLLARATVMPVPLDQGSGTRTKVLEAFAAGVAVISTRKGIEGLDVTDGVHLLLAESDDALASATVRALEDGDLRERLVGAGYQLVCARYSREAVADAVRNALASIAA